MGLLQHLRAFQAALEALRYLRPDLDPLKAEFGDLAATLAELGRVPSGVSNERFAAMLVWYVVNQDEFDEL